MNRPQLPRDPPRRASLGRYAILPCPIAWIRIGSAGTIQSAVGQRACSRSEYAPASGLPTMSPFGFRNREDIRGRLNYLEKFPGKPFPENPLDLPGAEVDAVAHGKMA